MIVDVRTGWPSDFAPLWQADHEPTWRDATIRLDNGAAVVPELAVLYTSASDEDDFFGVYDVELKLRFSTMPWDMRYKVESVKVNGLGSGEVSGTDLREVRVAELARIGASNGIFIKLDRDDPPASMAHWYGPEGPRFDTGDTGELVKKAGPNGWVLDFVALTYQLASLASQPPAKAVERAFGLQPRTAANWIAKAKATGALKPPALLNQEMTVPFSDDQLFKMQQRVNKPPANMLAWKEDDDGEHKEAP